MAQPSTPHAQSFYGNGTIFTAGCDRKEASNPAIPGVRVWYFKAHKGKVKGFILVRILRLRGPKGPALVYLKG